MGTVSSRWCFAPRRGTLRACGALEDGALQPLAMDWIRCLLSQGSCPRSCQELSENDHQKRRKLGTAGNGSGDGDKHYRIGNRIGRSDQPRGTLRRDKSRIPRVTTMAWYNTKIRQVN